MQQSGRHERHERERTTGATCVKVRSSSSEFKSNSPLGDDGVCVCQRNGPVRRRRRQEILFPPGSCFFCIPKKEPKEKPAELKRPDPLVHLIDLTPPTADDLLSFPTAAPWNASIC